MFGRRVLSVTIAAFCAAASIGSAASSAAAFQPDRSSLQRAGRWVVDDQGRVVVMHGVNLVQKPAPFYTDQVGEQDARFLADEGFNVAREGVIWEGLEPSPGKYDATYVQHLADLNDTLSRYGIRTLLDMHQDSWSAYATPGIGDGAPGWADLGAVMSDDFQDFWDNVNAPDGVPIQTHFVGGLIKLAQSVLGSSTNVLGYDPFNEPYAGTKRPCAVFQPCPNFETNELAAFYRRAIAGIRTVDRSHVIWPEGIAQNGQQPPALPKFSDAQTAFNFHYYCTATQGGGSANPGEQSFCPGDEARGIGNFETYARGIGVPSIMSEFAASAPTDDVQRVVELAGENFTSWTQWAYENDFNDPNQPFSESNSAQSELDAVVVPYPQAIAGTPDTWSFDPSTNVMRLAYTATAVPGAKLSTGAFTRIFVPERHYPTGYTAQVTGARVVSAPTSPWLELRASPGSAVSVVLKPRDGGFTLTPLQAGGFPLRAASACPVKRVVSVRVPASRGRPRSVRVYVNGQLVRAVRAKRLARRGGLLRLSVASAQAVSVRVVVVGVRGRAVTRSRFGALVCKMPEEW